MEPWTRLERALAGLGADVSTPSGGRLGGVLVLLAQRGNDLEVVYTRRREDLATHPGQVSFPGGRVEAGETVEEAAVREAAEEVALDPASVTLLGRLVPLYVPPSRYWISPVVARWDEPHPLAANEAEVAEIVTASVSVLRDARAWRAVRLSPVRTTWAWQLDDRLLLWGATALVTASLLDLLDPAWHGGTDPGLLGADREVRPWEGVPGQAGRRRGRALLPGTVERGLDTVGTRQLPRSAPLAADQVDRAGAAVAVAVARLLGPDRGRVLVLAGGGGTGAAGLDAARRLAQDGVDVEVVVPRPPATLRPPAAAAATRISEHVRIFAGELPPARLVVDALVGTGLSGPLAREERDVVLALRAHDAPVLAVDVPSGLDPVAGLVGDSVAADVTVALGTPQPGVLHPALAGFVGDLYVAPLDDATAADPLVRLVGAAAGG